ncbi:MAG: hypothetical protein J6P13_07705 [Kiritimatiellae bacterium]|nr:hypothetical protein [Kiritimatiellia bacterium]
MANAIVTMVIVALAAFLWVRGKKKGSCAVCSCGGCKKNGGGTCHCHS